MPNRSRDVQWVKCGENTSNNKSDNPATPLYPASPDRVDLWPYLPHGQVLSID